MEMGSAVTGGQFFFPWLSFCIVDQCPVSVFQFDLISTPDTKCGCILPDRHHGVVH